MYLQLTGSRRAPEEGETHDDDVFLGSTECRTGFRQQRKFECLSKMTADHGEKYI